MEMSLPVMQNYILHFFDHIMVLVGYFIYLIKPYVDSMLIELYSFAKLNFYYLSEI